MDFAFLISSEVARFPLQTFEWRDVSSAIFLMDSDSEGSSRLRKGSLKQFLLNLKLLRLVHDFSLKTLKNGRLSSENTKPAAVTRQNLNVLHCRDFYCCLQMYQIGIFPHSYTKLTWHSRWIVSQNGDIYFTCPSWKQPIQKSKGRLIQNETLKVNGRSPAGHIPNRTMVLPPASLPGGNTIVLPIGVRGDKSPAPGKFWCPWP